jgi:hypothetical protein
MFGIGGDARLYGLLSIARLALEEVAVSLDPVALEVVDAAAPAEEVAEGLQQRFPNRVRPFPAWRSSTRS